MLAKGKQTAKAEMAAMVETIEAGKEQKSKN